MPVSSKIKALIFILFLGIFFISVPSSGQGFSTKGTDFWFGFMENYLGEDSIQTDRMKVYITADDIQATGTVSVPLGGWSQNFVVAPNSTIEITIPTAIAMCVETELIENKGVHVTSDNPVSVYQLNYVRYTSDANIILPTLSLGTRYRVTTYTPSPASPTWTEVSPSELLVVGIFDNTVIKITTKCNTEGGHGANVPFNITLNKGEVYQIRAYYSSMYSLTGTLIEIDTTVTDNCKTFAVFSGNKCAFVPGDSCCCNHICEEMMPINTWGKKYITVPLEDRASDVFRIVASKNGTIFTIDGGLPQGLNAGAFYETDRSTPAYIESNYPISVAQFSKSGQTDGNEYSDPFMIMLNPLEQTIDRIVFNSFVTPIIEDYYVNIVTKTANTGLVMLDGVGVVDSFSTVASNTLYSYAQIRITQGNHILVCDSGLTANVYGYGWYETYGYMAGGMVKDLNIFYSIISPSATVPYYEFTDTICRGTSLSFEALNIPSIITHYWNFGDGSPIVYGPSVSHTYNDAGKYKLTYYYQRNNVCGLDSILWEINVKCCNPPPSITADSPICVIDSSTVTDVSIFNPNATYTWDFGSGTVSSGSGQGPYEIHWAGPGTDTIWVFVSDTGCPVDSDSYMIEIKPIPGSPFEVISPVCYKEVTTATYTGNASPAATYNWNFNGGLIVSGTGQGPYSLYWLNTGTFDVSLSVFESGCFSETTYVPVTVYPPPGPGFSADPQTAYIEDPTIHFLDNSANTVSWSWNFGDTASGLNNFSSQTSPTHIYSGPGQYDVWLVAVSPDGCIDSISLPVKVIELFNYYIPNTITPNADGMNDVFYPFSASEMYFTLSIYDRWGIEIFVGKEQEGWDGTYKGEVVEPGIYAWCMNYSFGKYQLQIAYGHVLVLK
ncbi:MAG TPA: PKD domain-containing protein [Bacteroidales bacterium]|nr:PKD domain-containing protein [Bacteroidales bacterium]